MPVMLLTGQAAPCAGGELVSPVGLRAQAPSEAADLDEVHVEEWLPPGAELQPLNGSNLIPTVGFS